PPATQEPQHQHQPSPEPSNQSKETLEAKTAFTATLRSVGENHETQIRDRARTLHANASALSRQETELQRTTEALRKQNDGWAKVADQARDGLKEIGDVQNWAELIERDLLVVEETVRLAEEKENAMQEEGREDEGGERGGNGDADGDGKDVDGGKKGKGKGKGWLWW
ncbi:hypothetical protein P170DRAFT_325524, partial [Aspergillus steynii IBT 23096]